MITPKRGTIYLADLNPPRGTEPGKKRPVVVVQTNLLNGFHPSTLICPLTTNVNHRSKYLRIHLKKHDSGLKIDSDIMVDQLRAIDNKRFIHALGKVPPSQLAQLDRSLGILLDLS